MRNGPSFHHFTRRLATFTLVLGSVFALSAVAAPKKDLQELRGRIQSLQKKLDSAEASRSEAADALKQSEQAISDINRNLHGLALKQAATKRALNRLGRQQARAEKDIQGQRKRLGALLYQQYLHRDGDYLELLLNGRDPNRIARHMRYYGYVSRARAELIDGLNQDMLHLRQLTETARRKDAELAAIKDQQASQRAQLQQQRHARKQVLAHLSHQIRNQRKEIDRLRRDEKHLTALVERLARLATRKRGRPGLRNRQLPEAALAGIPFPKLKGRLHLPVVGELVNRFGSPREDTGVPWKGLFIKASPGRPVKAIANGRVVFADWLRGFGNLIILDHGDGYMSLYADNESLYKQVGDEVRAGDTIATVGNSGGNPESGLYFELRFRSKPLDPLTWMTLK